MNRLIAGHDESEYSELFSGLTKLQVRAMMGCPSTGMATDAAGKSGSIWTYEGVPLKPVNTIIRFNDDHAESVETVAAKK